MFTSAYYVTVASKSTLKLVISVMLAALKTIDFPIDGSYKNHCFKENYHWIK